MPQYFPLPFPSQQIQPPTSPMSIVLTLITRTLTRTTPARGISHGDISPGAEKPKGDIFIGEIPMGAFIGVFVFAALWFCIFMCAVEVQGDEDAEEGHERGFYFVRG